MANLSSASTVIQIQPYNRETSLSDWIETKISIQYNIQEQKSYIALPSDNVSIQVKDFSRLIGKARKYVSDLPVGLISFRERQDEYSFSPLETDFRIKLSDGFYFDKSCDEGTIFVTFNMSLKALGVEELASDEVSCKVKVKITELLNFLNDLEKELGAV